MIPTTGAASPCGPCRPASSEGRLYHVITDWRRFEGDWLRGLQHPGRRSGYPRLGAAGHRGRVCTWPGAKGFAFPWRLDHRPRRPFRSPRPSVGWGTGSTRNCSGARPTSPWAVEIDPEHRPPEYLDSATFHPTFLYEGLWNLSLALLIVWIDRKKKVRPGKLFAIYVGGYGLGRLWVESMRVDPATQLFGVRVNIWVSLVLIVFGIGWFLWGGWQRRPGDSDYPYVGGREPSGDDDDVEADRGPEARRRR